MRSISRTLAVALLASACATPSAVAPPHVVSRAPDPGIVLARAHTVDANVNAVTFREMDRFFPVEQVRAGAKAVLPLALRPMTSDVTIAGKPYAFAEALHATQTNALLVLHKGRIVDERYFNGSDENSRFTSWSMAKSIVSILVGICVDRGLIGDVSEPIDAYLPDLKGTAYEGVTIEQMLMMRDGTDYTEQKPGGKSTLEIVKERSTYRNEMRFTDVSGLGLKRANEPGSTFNYSTLTSGILGHLVEAASGKTLAAFTEEALWKPAGMEGDAYWMLDGELPEGHAIGGAGFNAKLRDYGRIAQMMLDGGRANGRQIVSKAWVEKSTRYAGTTPLIPGAPRGYQYQWWTMIGTQRFDAIGIHGQFITIDPVSQTVIVKLSYWPETGGSTYNLAALALFEAIRNEVSAR